MPSLRSDEDLRLWKEWNSTGRKMPKLEPLMGKFDGLVNKQVNVYKGKAGVAGNIPEAALRAEIKNNLVDAFETFDPKRGVQLSTHAQNHMKKTYRFMATYQNIGRIPEPYINRIGEYERAQSRLTEQLRRPPTTIELAGELKWPMSHVETMHKSLRKDLSLHSFQADPIALRTSRFEEVKGLIPYELNPQENAVFELLMRNQDKPMSKLQIASRLNISPSRVSKINKKIASKIGQYVNG